MSPYGRARRRRRTVCSVLVVAGLVVLWQTLRAQPERVPTPAALPKAATAVTPSRPAPPPPRAVTPPRPAPPPPRAVTPPPPGTASDLFAPTGRLLLPVRVQSQLPALPNGCEVTSLSMLLDAVGAPADKLTLAREQPTLKAQPSFGRPGDFYSIISWGNPHTAFVGNVAGRYGYGIYHEPLSRLLREKVGDRTLDLTGRGFSEILARVRTGTPVLVWTTTSMRPPTAWVTWNTPEGPFRATAQEHAVLIVGYTQKRLIINNPLSGKQEAVDPGPFISAWQQLGRQALTVSG